MKKIMIICLAAFAVAATAFTVTTVLPIGAEMPKATQKMKDVSGAEVSMSEVVKKNGVLVMFSCNTCPYVIKNEKRIVDIANFANKMEVGVILLNSNEAQRGNEDSFEDMKSYAAAQKFSWKYVVDQNSEVADAFGANRTPECFLFNKDMKLAYHGAIDDNPSDASNVTRTHLREAIKEMAAGKEVSVKESKSVGCTIKRK